MNKIAEKLIDRLRNDDYTRKHFSIGDWAGKNSCGTVGCIAGTAIAMEHGFRRGANSWEKQYSNIQISDILDGLARSPEETSIKSYVDYGSEALGIHHRTGCQLFLPWGNWWGPLVDTFDQYEVEAEMWGHLSHNEKPSKDYVEELKKWARDYEPDASKFTPDVCALALERVFEVPYVDWKHAFENA